MREYGFSLTVFSDIRAGSSGIKQASENPYSGIFYAVKG